MRSEPPVILVDTNVLVYAYDPAEPEKQERAREVLTEIREVDAGALTVQVLGEFYSATTRKLFPPLSPEVAAQAVVDYVASWPVCDLTRMTILRAVQAVPEHKLSYWDALVWASAKENGMRIILTEDLQDGQLLGGVLVRNPFAEDFDLKSIL